MQHSLFLWGGFFLGCLHALDADHLATVSALTLVKQPFRKTFFMALRWSLGHSLTLLVLGGLTLAMKNHFQSPNLSLAEQLVGFSMICLGAWVLYREWNNRKRCMQPSPSRRNPSATILFGMGVLHGTAGYSSIMLLIPVTLSSSPLSVFGYILLFSAGMILTMSLYALLLNKILWIRNCSTHLVRVRCFAGFLTIMIGIRLLYYGT